MDKDTVMKPDSMDHQKTETFAFQAEVGRLLDIVAHALYSDKDFFLRELIANAADAIEKQRYDALTTSSAASGGDAAHPPQEYAIRLIPDEKAGTLTIQDNGIGMDRQDLIDNLGTIAHSGTARFLKMLQEQEKPNHAMTKDNLIGQFGVGFYAAYMVADRVDVITRKAGTSDTWHWHSDGKGGFSIKPALETLTRGSKIILHLRADAGDYFASERLTGLVKHYSDHIAVPILLKNDQGESRINSATALWTRPRSEITDEQLSEFYRDLAHDGVPPRQTIHLRAEGVMEYAALLFIPGTRPFDLYTPERRHALKLYVKRVFITENCAGLIPPWLRFLRGVVDSADLPLNISRETLQDNPVIGRIRKNLTRKILTEIEKLAEKPEEYAAFWDDFGGVLKEGLYEDFDHREILLNLVRFRSSQASGWVDLAGYVDRMVDGQKEIFTLSAESVAQAEKNPHLEGFRAKNIEVLYLTDPVDEFWLPMIGAFMGKKFISITKGDINLSSIGGTKAADQASSDAAVTTPEGREKSESDNKLKPLLALMKLTLADQVKDVRTSQRLTTSAVCLVAEANDMDLRLAKLLREQQALRQAGGDMPPQPQRVLEINPHHPMIRQLCAWVGDDKRSDYLADAAFLLLDQARISEGELPMDARQFARRLERILAAVGFNAG
ncbi:MAG: molecular chaperone HtpG [Candidatus Symbiobacter sp.]|nr:molecular chaperone HtpG [Candidatus Symbiobacter sp.]